LILKNVWTFLLKLIFLESTYSHTHYTDLKK